MDPTPGCSAVLPTGSLPQEEWEKSRARGPRQGKAGAPHDPGPGSTAPPLASAAPAAGAVEEQGSGRAQPGFLLALLINSEVTACTLLELATTHTLASTQYTHAVYNTHSG